VNEEGRCIYQEIPGKSIYWFDSQILKCKEIIRANQTAKKRKNFQSLSQ
jgi:hypothetical protein